MIGRGIAASRRQRRRPQLSRSHRARVSSADGVGRKTDRLIEWVAGISTTERKKVPRREQQDIGVRQGAERV